MDINFTGQCVDGFSQVFYSRFDLQLNGFLKQETTLNLSLTTWNLRLAVAFHSC